MSEIADEAKVIDGVLILPEGTTHIEASAFVDRADFTGVVLPDSLVEIGEEAFLDCTSLEQLTLPKNVRTIGDYAFAGCASLQEIYILGDEVNMGRDVFDDCSSLEQLTIYGDKVCFTDVFPSGYEYFDYMKCKTCKNKYCEIELRTFEADENSKLKNITMTLPAWELNFGMWEKTQYSTPPGMGGLSSLEVFLIRYAAAVEQILSEQKNEKRFDPDSSDDSGVCLELHLEEAKYAEEDDGELRIDVKNVGTSKQLAGFEIDVAFCSADNINTHGWCETEVDGERCVDIELKGAGKRFVPEIAALAQGETFTRKYSIAHRPDERGAYRLTHPYNATLYCMRVRAVFEGPLARAENGASQTHSVWSPYYVLKATPGVNWRWWAWASESYSEISRDESRYIRRAENIFLRAGIPIGESFQRRSAYRNRRKPIGKL